MSIVLSNAVWNHSRQKSGALIVLVAIADYANESGKAWPSVKTLARMARMSSRNVQRCLRKMEKEGELQILPKKAPHGTNLLKILLSGEAGWRQRRGCRHDNSAAEGAAAMSQAHDSSVTQSVNEPSTNH